MKNDFASKKKMDEETEKKMKFFDLFTVDIVDELMFVVVLSIYLH